MSENEDNAYNRLSQEALEVAGLEDEDLVDAPIDDGKDLFRFKIAILPFSEAKRTIYGLRTQSLGTFIKTVLVRPVG